MPQNIDDDPAFFAAYSRLDRSVAGLDGAPEWPGAFDVPPFLLVRAALGGAGAGSMEP